MKNTGLSPKGQAVQAVSIAVSKALLLLRFLCVAFGSLIWLAIGMKVTSVAFTEAKAHLSEYGRLAEEGRSTVVLKHRHLCAQRHKYLRIQQG